jgi:hypothetical protein
VDLHRYQAVDLGAGDLLEDGCSLIGRGLEKGRESPLRKEHRTGEAREVHARGRHDEFTYLDDSRFENLSGHRVCYFMPRLLQLAAGPFPGAVLAPVAAVAALLRLEGDLGKAFAGLPRHDLVAAFGDLVQTGRPAVEPKADGIEDSRLSRAGGTGNGEQAVRRIGRIGEIDLPFAGERIEVLEPYSEYPHAATFSDYPAIGSASLKETTTSR